jgi:hypothetical protein
MLTGGSADGFGLVAGGLQKGLDLLPGNEDFSEDFAGAEIPPLDEPPNGLGGTIEDCGGLVDVVSQGLRQGGCRRGIWRLGRLDFLSVHSRFSLSFLSPLLGDGGILANPRFAAFKGTLGTLGDSLGTFGKWPEEAKIR